MKLPVEMIQNMIRHGMLSPGGEQARKPLYITTVGIRVYASTDHAALTRFSALWGDGKIQFCGPLAPEHMPVTLVTDNLFMLRR